MNTSGSFEQFKLLVRTFFDDFVTPVSEEEEEDERTSLLPYVLGALVGPGAFFCFYELPRYADIRIKLAPMSQQGATIELDGGSSGISIGNEGLTLNSFVDSSPNGGLRNVTGNNTWGTGTTARATSSSK